MKRISDSPFVLCGRDICVLHNQDCSVIHSIFVSPSGKVFISGDISDGIKDLIASWTIRDLNDISSDYYYMVWGQAFFAIDLMAKYGYLSYKSASDFERKVNRCLSSRDFVVVKEAV